MDSLSKPWIKEIPASSVNSSIMKLTDFSKRSEKAARQGQQEGEGWVRRSNKELQSSPPTPFENHPDSRLVMHPIYRASYLLRSRMYFQIDAFDTDHYVMMPYNLPEYPGYAEAAGYWKVKDPYA